MAGLIPRAPGAHAAKGGSRSLMFGQAVDREQRGLEARPVAACSVPETKRTFGSLRFPNLT